MSLKRETTSLTFVCNKGPSVASKHLSWTPPETHRRGFVSLQFPTVII